MNRQRQTEQTHADDFQAFYEARADGMPWVRNDSAYQLVFTKRDTDLEEGFARVRCPDCHHGMFVAFSCKQRCACPSCHQKRTLLTALHVAEEVCAPVAHRQVVLTIPKRLRLHARFDRSLLGKLSRCAWMQVQAQRAWLAPRAGRQ